MKRLLVLVALLAGVVGAVGAEPSPDQWAFVKKYDGMTFSTQGLKAGVAQSSGWVPYGWTEGRTLWENPKQGLFAVTDPQGREVYRYAANRYEYHFPNGRVIKSDPTTGTVTWNPSVGDIAPDFDLPSLDGKTRVKLSSLRGSVVFLDFWASWCGPCQSALPGTEALHSRFKSKGLKVLGINIEGDVKAAQANATSLKLTFPSLVAENGPDGPNWNSRQIVDFGINSIPRGVLVDKKGIIRAEDTVLEVNALIEKLLAE